MSTSVVGSNRVFTECDKVSISIDSSGIDLQNSKEFRRMEDRVELLERTLEMVPGIIGEAILTAVDAWADAYDPCSYPSGNLCEENREFQANRVNRLDSDQGEHIVKRMKMMHPFGRELAVRMRGELEHRVNFDELHSLRSRVKQLEEDLGYRTAVADRLMEE